MVAAVGDEHAAVGADGDVARRPQARLRRHAAVAAESGAAVAGDRRDHALRTDSPDRVVGAVDDVKRAARIDSEVRRLVESGSDRRTAVAVVAAGAGAGDRRDAAPSGAILRILLLPSSAMKIAPSVPIATSEGWSSCGGGGGRAVAAVAGRPVPGDDARRAVSRSAARRGPTSRPRSSEPSGAAARPSGNARPAAQRRDHIEVLALRAALRTVAEVQRPTDWIVGVLDVDVPPAERARRSAQATDEAAPALPTESPGARGSR